MKDKTKIALIQPDSPFLFEPLAFPSLGLLYVASYLKQKGYTPKVFDLNGGVKLPKMLEADVIGFSSQITQFRDVVNLKNKLKERNPNSSYVIGGSFPTHSPQECLDAGFDVVVRGEGEIPMLEIVKNHPKLNNKIMFSKTHVDPNFFPSWDLIDPTRYNYYLNGKKMINLMTRRGNCPYHCTFCAQPEIGKSPLRFRSVENVIEEVKFLRDKYGFGAVAFYDDDVFIKKDRDKEIFKELHRLNIPYRCMTRVNLATKEDLQFLKDTGCAEVCIGAETGDSNILENILKKGATVKQNTDFVQNCHDIGLIVKPYMMVGVPGETKESIQHTKDWIRKTKSDNYKLFTFTPYPGSDIYNNKDKYDISWDEQELRNVWFSGTGPYGNCVVSTSSLSSKDIIKAKKDIEKEFPNDNTPWGKQQNEKDH
ncbi:MAG: B12-binding domain-containing radical SAM protein [Nanoarchaeota archaeon]|nr:B12-binding domain-containing radical SAM protein [Nanoarchaeota archaeon]